MGEAAEKNVYRDLADSLEAGEKAVLVTKLGPGGSEKRLFAEAELLGGGNLTSGMLAKAQEALGTGNLQFTKETEEEFVFFEPCFPEPRLIVFGGGHISKPLVEFGAKVGFKTTVIDDRPSFANAGRFPLAERVICESFERCFKLFDINASSFIVIVTRGHKHDMLCLKEVLRHNAAYVGMIGSKRRIKIVREQLLEEGYTEEQLQRLNAPIGVEIDAVTPEEIAVSIIVQVISFRRKKTIKGGLSYGRVNWPELDREVIDELAKVKGEPKAIATILSTKGSAPRKAGAKMLVFSDGRTLGSIGGGCSEGEVILAARDVLRDGKYRFQTVDMTGYVAEDEGMVCGGIMEVVIEYSHF